MLLLLFADPCILWIRYLHFLHMREKHSRTWNILLFQVPQRCPRIGKIRRALSQKQPHCFAHGGLDARMELPDACTQVITGIHTGLENFTQPPLPVLLYSLHFPKKPGILWFLYLHFLHMRGNIAGLGIYITILSFPNTKA